MAQVSMTLVLKTVSKVFLLFFHLFSVVGVVVVVGVVGVVVVGVVVLDAETSFFALRWLSLAAQPSLGAVPSPRRRGLSAPAATGDRH